MEKFLRFFSSATLLLIFPFTLACLANAATFTVDTVNDTVDVSPGNGVCADSTGACTLRAAIQESNALAGADNINLPIGSYELTIDELQITGDLTINGTGVGSTVINGSNQYRVFSILDQVPSYVVSISGVTITGGYLGCADGGGIYNRGNFTITDSLVSNNIANRCGSTGGNAGGIYSDGMLTLINSTVSGNKSAGLSVGGGIWNNGGTLTITNSTVSNNSTGTPWSQGEVQGSGGGIYNSGPLSITNSTIRGNFSINGGGIRHDNGELTIINSTINNNTAYYLSGILTGHGGGIFAVSGTVDVVSSTINDNRAYWSSVGGESAAGLYNSGATVTIVNSTISGNDTSTFITGGINNYSGTLTITNSTISGNTGATAGIRRSGGTLSLSNTIVADQVSGPDCSGTIISIGYNLDSDGTCGLTEATDISEGSANLRPLTDNGGPTLTHALGAGSDAVDAGDETVCANAPINGSDQRASRRSDGACDIGAFEAIRGDVNIDGSVNLLDTIVSLQALSGMETPKIDPIADINGDSKIGIQEAIYSLQVTSAIRLQPSDTSAAAGFWHGTSTDQNNNTFTFGGIISTDGQLRFLIDEGDCFGTQFKGIFSMDGDTGSGTFTGYAGGLCVFSNGEILINGTINFTIAGVEMTGTFSSQEYSGTFSLTYDPAAKNPITLTDLAGRWTAEEGDYSEIIVSANGSFTGTGGSGCTLSGLISIIDPDWSITEVLVTVSGCDDASSNGVYTGLGLWQQHDEGRETFAIVVSSSTSSAFGFFAQMP